MPNDRQVWAETSNGFFSIRSAYKLTLELETNREIGSCSDGSNIWFWKKLWSIQIPHKIRHFAWRAARDILPTKENLVCRKVWLIACVRNAAMLQNLSFICFGSALRFETHGFLHLSSLHCCWFLFGPSLSSYGMFWWMHSGLWKMLALLLLLHGLCGLIEMRWFMASWGRQVCYWLIGVDHTWKSIRLQAISL